jgi:O-antigen/teichoic acid export membrane protein
MQSVYVLVVVLLGDADLGGLRLVMALLGPVQLVVASIQFVGLPSASRRHAEHGMRDAVGPALQLSGIATAIASVYLVVLSVGSEHLLLALVGPAYASFSGLALPVALGFVISVVALGPTLAVKAAGAGRAFATVQVVVLVLRVGLTAALASAAGLMGAAWALAVASLVEASLLWIVLRRAARRAEQAPVSTAGVALESA